MGLAVPAEGLDQGTESFAEGGEEEAPEEHGCGEASNEEASGRAEGESDSGADRRAKDRRCEQRDAPQAVPFPETHPAGSEGLRGTAPQPANPPSNSIP